MTKDGFTLLVMGFTGKKALHFKMMYINEFNSMEAELKKLAQVRTQLLNIQNNTLENII